MHLDLLTLHKLAPKGFLAVLLQIKHNLVPSLIQLQRHRTFERLNTSNRLVVAGDKSTLHVLIVQDSHLESEVFVQLHRAITTFLTSSTRIGSFIFIEPFLALGKAMKLLRILEPLISKTGSSISISVMRLMWPLRTA